MSTRAEAKFQAELLKARVIELCKLSATMEEIINETGLSNVTIRKYAGDYVKLITIKNTKSCCICETQFTLKYPGSSKFKTFKNVCSYECYLQAGIKESILKHPDDTDYAECKECGYRALEIQQHVVMVHNMGAAEYKSKHNSGFVCESQSEVKSARFSGELNPAYQHGGKFSPFSEKSIKHSKETRVAAAAKKLQSIKDNPQNRSSHIEYWLKHTGGNVEAAQKLYSERQRTFTLEKCIKRYGEEEGMQRWKDRQEKWMKNYTKSNFSKISQKLFWDVYNRLEPILQNDTFFAELDKGRNLKNNEYVLKLNTCTIKPDFIVLSNKRIIEFDGTYWHRENLQANVTRNLQRDQSIIESGYEVLHVKEADYKNNKEEIITKCINFLTQ